MPRVPLCLPIVLCLAHGMLHVLAAHTDHAHTFRIRSIPPWHVSPTEARAPPPPSVCVVVPFGVVTVITFPSC